MSGEILDNLHPQLRIAWESMGAFGVPASKEDLAELFKYFPNPPDEYLEIIKRYECLCIEALENAPNYLSFTILSPLDVVGWLDWCPWLRKQLPGCFFFARDGDIGYFIGENKGRVGVYKVEISAAFWDEADYIAPSIRDWLCKGMGWATSNDLK